MILYIFITCLSNFHHSYNRITNMMTKLNNNDFVIVKGMDSNNKQIELYDELTHVLSLDSNDYYEGLPEKTIKSFKFIYNNSLFDKYTFLCKLDDDIIIKQLFKFTNLPDYCGRLNNSYDGDRKWHIGKCSKNSIFNTTEYKGYYVPWCLGGNGYFLSRNALKFIILDMNYKNEIYEDLYVAKILHRNNIFPINLPILSDFFYCKDHY